MKSLLIQNITKPSNHIIQFPSQFASEYLQGESMDIQPLSDSVFAFGTCSLDYLDFARTYAITLAIFMVSDKEQDLIDMKMECWACPGMTFGYDRKCVSCARSICQQEFVHYDLNLDYFLD